MWYIKIYLAFRGIVIRGVAPKIKKIIKIFCSRNLWGKEAAPLYNVSAKREKNFDQRNYIRRKVTLKLYQAECNIKIVSGANIIKIA